MDKPTFSSVQLSDVVDRKRTIRYGVVQPGEFDPNGRYLIRGQDYSFGWAEPSTLFRVSDAIESKYKNARVRSGDVLLTIVGAGTGNVAIVPEWLDGANITQTTARIAANPDVLDNHYLFHYLSSYLGKKLVAQNIKGAAQPGLNCGDIDKFEITIPSLSEQRRIAKILSTWDEAIEQQTKLIELKEKRKKALMQKLLSGEVRFGKGEWKRFSVAEIFEFLSTSSHSREQLSYEHEGVPIFNIHYGDIHATYDSVTLDLDTEIRIPSVNPEVRIGTSVDYLIDGDLIIADASEDYEGVAACVELKNVRSRRVIGGLHTFALRDKGFTVDGIRPYLLKNENVANEIKKIATGSKVYGISKTNFSGIQLLVPSKNEQKKIAALLHSCDEELRVLKNELLKLSVQKQGMMQQLLTGNIKAKG